MVADKGEGRQTIDIGTANAHHAVGHAAVVAVVRPVETGLQLEGAPVHGGAQLGGIDDALGIEQGAHIGCAAAHGVVVHDVIDFAAAIAGRDFAEPRGQAALLGFERPGVAVEFAAVHHAVGVGRFAAAALVAGRKHGVFGGGNAQLQHLVVAAEVRVDAVAVAIAVIAGFVVAGIGAQIAVAVVQLGIGEDVETVKAAHGQAGIAVRFEFFGLGRRFAHKTHRTGHHAHAFANALRAFGYNHFVERGGENIGGGRIHAVAAAAVDKLAVGLNAQPRAAQAAQQRIARAAAFADNAHIGHRLQHAGAVVGRKRLDRCFGVELHRIGLAGRRAADHNRIQLLALPFIAGIRKRAGAGQ